MTKNVSYGKMFMCLSACVRTIGIEKRRKLLCGAFFPGNPQEWFRNVINARTTKVYSI